jgi:uncharacterized membrane protein YbaN (DUF454 family)
MTKLREATGFALVIAGLLGMLLPLIPGAPLLLAGVAVLGTSHPRIQPWIERIERWRCSLQGYGNCGFLGGRSREAAIEPVSNMATTAREATIGILYKSASIIFVPTKASTSARPTLR